MHEKLRGMIYDEKWCMENIGFEYRESWNEKWCLRYRYEHWCRDFECE